MKKRISVYFLIITICLLHLLVPDVVFGQAVQVFNKYKQTFEHPDIHEFFPDVLNAFKNPKKGAFLNPAVIERFAGEPNYIRRLHADTHDSILIRLLLDPAFQNLFLDEQFHTLVTRPTQVDALVKLIRQTTPKPRDDGCEPPVPAPPKATTLAIVSGDDQKGQAGTLLQDPFVVEVWDQNSKVLADIDVEFRVTAGGGSLSLTRVRTNNTGKASVTLTLGSGKEKNRVIASVVGVGVSLTQPFTAEAFNADVNKDGVVSIIDLSIFLSLIEQPNRPIAGIDMDINDDEIVDHEDLVLLVSALEPTAAAPSVHALVKIGISAADIRVLLTQTKALPETIQGDPVYQRGIVGLERLLAILTQVPAVPKRPALLVNYPNPFNPETWIPYQLSEASDVTVDIYALNGSRVRTLTLGHRPAGLYQRKNRAAYWDGRNAFGEPVASGLYFYTLTAGDFTATRKMLIRK